MFQLYLKKEQYKKVSSKFKNHLHNRDVKIDQVTSKQNKIQEKMKAFNQLINDDFQSHKKQSTKILKQNQSQQKFIQQLLRTTQGFHKLKNSKNSKTVHKQNIFSQHHQYLDQNQTFRKRNHQVQKFKTAFTQDHCLHSSKISRNKQRFATEVKTQIQKKSFLSKYPNYLNQSLRNSPAKQTWVQSVKDSQKQNLSRYLSSLKSYHRHKKHLSEVFNIGGNNTYLGHKSLQKSVLSKTFCVVPNLYKKSQKSKFKTKILKNENIFGDDNLQEQMNKTLLNASGQQNFRVKDSQENNLQKMPHYLLNPIKKRGLHMRNKTGFQTNSFVGSNQVDESAQKKKINAVRNFKFL